MAQPIRTIEFFCQIAGQPVFLWRPFKLSQELMEQTMVGLRWSDICNRYFDGETVEVAERLIKVFCAFNFTWCLRFCV